ncbi:hypothetical protein NQ314_013947 [Rhamnusium bicolor]|uniref:Transmembrane protein n=1 Tax=Rhamnusium bicolor TaxID=1586634 RepID=A0AAV8X3C3_9CUCU|nr:hypothetical protein NQ314_013947 [Rhamnusium bicolor]
MKKMTFQKISKWFLTDTGKNFCFYAAGTVTTSVLLCNFLPHTLLLNQYKDLVHLYKNGFSVPLTQKLEERFQRALDLVEVNPIDKHLYKPFFCIGFDVMSAGSSYSRFGVQVGLPSNFAYETEDMVDKYKIKFNFYTKPLRVRLIIYSLISLFGLGTYAMSKDMTQLYYEEKIDRQLKQTNILFAEGGKEYYNKLLERNQAFRKLLGREGERLYSTLGNENYLFRNKHIPLVQRKSFFEEPLTS